MIFTAFSYSDENFTVIGNLCFVHINIKNKYANYDIPPAIRDRMLIDEIYYPHISYDETNTNVGIAFINKYRILCQAQYDNGYLNVNFPIDSNK